MVARLGLLVSRTIGRFVPDPFLLAIALTLATVALAFLVGYDGVARGDVPGRLLASWWGDGTTGGGLWNLLAFSMQMCLVLVTGYALAASPPVKRAITALADVPRGNASAAALVALAACATGLLNWGLALIVGALLARAVGESLARRGMRAHYPLICAAGYTGLLVWHGGLSGSAPLSMTTVDGAAKVLPADVVASLGESATVPLGETLFSPLNLFVAFGLLAIVPATAALLAPRASDDTRTMEDLAVGARTDAPAPESRASIPAIVLGVTLGVALLGGLAAYVANAGVGRLGLNQINAAMFGLGLLLHGSPLSYLHAVERGARGCAGIIVQFPLYAGAMAIMADAGLISWFATRLTDGAGETALPLLTFVSAGVVNVFVPSGGGQWAVQGPIALEAAATSGVPLGKMILSVAYGDQLTNMLQPFWALPLLAITGVKARDIVGYTAILMLIAAAWIVIGLLLF